MGGGATPRSVALRAQNGWSAPKGNDDGRDTGGQRIGSRTGSTVVHGHVHAVEERE